MEQAGVETFELRRPMPLLLRLVLGGFGMFAIVMSAWDLRHAFIRPGWHSLFFGVIMLGAWFVGGAFVAIAIFGEAQRWVVRDGEIEIFRRTLWRKWSSVIRGADIAAISVREIEWDSRADSFSVVLRSKTGEAFETPEFEKREDAIDLETRLRRRLELD